MKIKIVTVRGSAGIVLPRQLLVRLRARKGDTLYATLLADGIKLTAFDPKHMEVAERVMQKNRNLLRRLAESRVRARVVGPTGVHDEPQAAVARASMSKNMHGSAGASLERNPGSHSGILATSAIKS
jgi:putative addiction module antidote